MDAQYTFWKTKIEPNYFPLQMGENFRLHVIFQESTNPATSKWIPSEVNDAFPGMTFWGQKLNTLAVGGAKGCRNGDNCGKKVVKKNIYQQITRPFVERRKSLKNKSSWHPPNNISTLFGGQPVRETEIQKKSFCNCPSGSLMSLFRENWFPKQFSF